jgi:hypothetical protein
VMVDGVLPDARAKVKVTNVHSNHARADELERLPMDEDVDEDDTEATVDDDADDDEAGDDDRDRGRVDRERLGSRENFWGN